MHSSHPSQGTEDSPSLPHANSIQEVAYNLKYELEKHGKLEHRQGAVKFAYNS